MPRLKEIDVNYEQIRELFSQLDFEDKMALIREVVKDVRYRDNFYAYTHELAIKYNIPDMNEEELSRFLHRNN